MKTLIIITLFVLMVLCVGCGPSPEAIATQTATAATAIAASWTATPTNTPTATPTNTPTATPTNTPTTTPTPTPAITMIKGSLIPWDEEGVIDNRQIVLCQTIRVVNKTPTDCILLDKAVTSDAQGTFQISEISSGNYFILYDTGLSDFKAGLDEWKGKTLELSDIDWIIEQYCGSPDGNVNIHFLGGMSISRESMISLIQALHTCDSPFVLALDPDGSNNAPLIVNVKDGQTTEIEFKVGFGK